MVAPSYNRVRNKGSDSWNSGFSSYQNYYVQKKPYTLNQPLLENAAGGVEVIKSGYLSWPNKPSFYRTLVWNQLLAQPSADNQCYSKFRSRVMSANASLLTAIAESNQTRLMIVKRAKMLVDLALALKNLNIRRAASLVGGASPRVKKVRPKDIASQWLEWSFGWRPAIQDIHDGLEVILSPIESKYVTARVQYESQDDRIRYSERVGVYPTSFRDHSDIETFDYRYAVRTGAHVRVENPDVALLWQLGLIDVPGTVWEIIPFSFILDKYLNISQLLKAVTDFRGLKLVDPFTSRALHRHDKGKIHNFGNAFGPVYDNNVSIECWSWAKNRSLSLLSPVPTMSVPKLYSVGEAGSYLALLVQLLSSK